MSLAAVTVANSIAGLSVSGVTLKALDEIPEKVDGRDCPIIYPNPDGFLSNLDLEVDSFGSASAKKTVSYNLNYMYLHSPIGSGRGLFDKYESVVSSLLAFFDAVISNDTITGCVDIQPQDATSFGPVSDPSGNVFHGCIIVLRVTELVN